MISGPKKRLHFENLTTTQLNSPNNVLRGRSLFRGPGGVEFSNRAVKNFLPLPFEASGTLYLSQNQEENELQ